MENQWGKALAGRGQLAAGSLQHGHLINRRQSKEHMPVQDYVEPVREHVAKEKPAKARGTLSHMEIEKTSDKQVQIIQPQKAKIVEYQVQHLSI